MELYKLIVTSLLLLTLCETKAFSQDMKTLSKQNIYSQEIASDPKSFDLKDKTLEEKFNVHVATYGIVGIKGHRSVGGFRASIYNALLESGVDVLVEAMKEFEKKF